MKVLYFHQHFSTPAGATGTRSYEMAKALIASGHQVTVVCGGYGLSATGLNTDFKNGRRTGLVEGIRVVELQLPVSNKDVFLKRAVIFLMYAVKTSLLALREEYDLLFATSTPLTAAIPGILAFHLRRKKFVFEVRDLWPELPKAMGVIRNPAILWALEWLERAAYRAACGCIGLSPGICQEVRRVGPTGLPVVMIPNGCDVDFFQEPVPAEPIPGVLETDFVAVFTGAHGIANGLEALIDVAIELRLRGRSEIKLVLIGDGMQKKSLELGVLKNRLSNVVFIDPIPKIRLRAMLKNADLGLMVLKNVPAFYFGTSPNKFFDYIAQALPVLNNYPGWLADLISKEGIGLAVEPDNAKAFADALEWFADADVLSRKKMRARSLRLAEEQFCRSKLAAEFVSFLEECARIGGPNYD